MLGRTVHGAEHWLPECDTSVVSLPLDASLLQFFSAGGSSGQALWLSSAVGEYWGTLKIMHARHATDFVVGRICLAKADILRAFANEMASSMHLRTACKL